MVIREIKIPLSYHFKHFRLIISKKEETANAAENKEKREAQYTAGGIAIWYSHWGKE